ncbi:MAG: hypothetical protein IJU10_02730 [Clostridia bacterium]|nr:hypothetical protein [Clostridia bacterium]
MPGVKINTKEDAFRLFDEAVKALINSNFIITQKPITDLLRCLVFSDKLQAFVSECLRGVDYEAELASAIAKTETGYAFILPKSNKRIIALVTGLLSDFDKGDRSLTTFIREFYPAPDNNQRYKLFCDNVLMPYHRAFRQSFLYDIDNADTAYGDEGAKVIGEAALEQAAGILSALRTIFLGDNKLSEKKRADLIYLTDGLYYSLEKGDARIIKTVWTGMKLALAGIKKAEKKFSELTEFLALYALL